MQKRLTTLINLSAALTTWFVSAAVFLEVVGTPDNWYEVTIAGVVFVGPVTAITQFLVLRTWLLRKKNEAHTHKNIMIVLAVYSATFCIYLAVSVLTPAPKTDFVRLMEEAKQVDPKQGGN